MKEKLIELFQRQTVMTAAACILLMGVLAAIAYSGVIGSGWGVLIFLLCPLMHIFLHRHHHSENAGVPVRVNQKKQDSA